VKYQEAIDWLYGTQLFGIKLGLEQVRRLLRELSLDGATEGCRVWHVAGTNGKGSVCAMSDAILRAAGLRAGLFTSPHLVTYRERIRVNGRMIPEAAVAAGLTDIRDLVSDWDPHPTFFEITLALAMGHFAAENCEAIVLETGMGGRLDATNAIDSDVAVITPIGFDHTQWLGETLAAIASEKAGIIKPGRPVLSAEQAPEAAAVIESAAREAHAPLRWISAEELPGDLSLNLAGPHQRANAALAVVAVRTLISGVSGDAIAAGLAKVEWPARFQRIGDRIVIDGAHNSHAAAVLLDTWLAEMGKSTRATVIFGGVANKDTAETLRRLAPLAARWIFVKVASQRGLAAEALHEMWESMDIGDEIESEIAASAAEALEKAKTCDEARPILITGSLYLAGEVIALLTGGPPFEKSEQ
jgi:dihydrofolate synthase/folylpolyglutamate synthase